MLRAGFLVAITAVSLVSGQELTVASVKSIFANSDLPDFKSCDPCIFHQALIEILSGDSEGLIRTLDFHGDRLKGLLLNSKVSVKWRHFQERILISAFELALILT